MTLPAARAASIRFATWSPRRRFCAGTAPAIPVYFDWTDISGGTAGAITATVVSNIVSGELGTNMVTATDLGFVSTYRATVPALSYNAPVSFTPGNVQSTITFSQPLPSGSLIAIGVPFEDTIPPVPAPAGLPLLLSGLALFGGFAWRRRGIV